MTTTFLNSVNCQVNTITDHIELRITKKEGIPIHLVPEGTPDAGVIGLKRVNELGYYSLGSNDLAERVGLTGPKARAIIWHLRMERDTEYFKE